MRLQVDITKELGGFVLSVGFDTEGEVFSLLGASGCGKSVTLKCIAGIMTPDQGRIVLGDRVLYDSEKRINVPARKRRVGYLFQDYALFPNMTAYQNIACVNPGRAKALIRQFCMEGKEGLYPSQLSGGQKQRVAIARMLAAKPEALLFDEPFSALDNYLQMRLEREIMDVLNEFEGPAIFVSHNRNEVYRIAGRIGVMENGSLIEIQDKKDFFDSPQTVTAARLTGCKNITRLEPVEDGGIWAVDWGIRLGASDKKRFEGMKYAGYRAHYFRRTDRMEPENVFTCRIDRVIEDTFSIVVCFRQMGQEENTPDAVLTWELPKEEWEQISRETGLEPLYLKLDEDKLMPFAR